jgi:hypothetical protein
MATSFATDFSAVRVHEDDAARSMGALAFTRGNDVHFAPGRFDPVSQTGQELIGHELAHVVQQRAGRVAVPQGKGAPINADPALEAEADALGARAARGERVAPGRVAPAGGGQAAPPQVVQRFEDPTTGDEITLEVIAQLNLEDVKRYIRLMMAREIKPISAAEAKALYQRQKHLTGTSEQDLLGESVGSMMDKANTGGGLRYLHNVPGEEAQDLRDYGQDPDNGYANPLYFDRLSKFTWRLKTGVSAAAAIRDFMAPENGYTIAECQTALQAVFYHTILNAVGPQKFDARLGSETVNVVDDQRLLLQMNLSDANPLNLVLETFHMAMDPAEQAEMYDDNGTKVSAPDYRPAKVGGWYYMKNHAFYSERHDGIWGGENAIYVGRDEGGHQIYSGFGLSNCTEEQMAEALADQCNAAPTNAKAEELIRRGKLGLALPVLGDAGSADQIQITEPGTIEAINRAYGFVGKELTAETTHPEATARARERLAELLDRIQDQLPQPVTAADILKSTWFSHEGMTEGARQGEVKGTAKKKDLALGWSEGQTPDAGIPCVTLRVTKARGMEAKVYGSDLIRFYCQQYNLDEEACIYRGSIQQLFGEMNPGLKGKACTTLRSGEEMQAYFPPPERYARIYLSGSGFQSMDGKNLDVAKIKQVFAVNSLFTEETIVHDPD